MSAVTIHAAAVFRIFYPQYDHSLEVAMSAVTIHAAAGDEQLGIPPRSESQCRQ